LGTNHLSPYFKHHAGNPLIADVLIIDESSMLDVALFAKLLDAIGPNTRLILLGDQNQLASVEAGSLFGDICSAVLSQNELGRSVLEKMTGILPENQLKRINQCQEDTFLQSNLILLNFSYRFKSDQKIGQLSGETVLGNWEAVRELLLDTNSPDQLVFDESYDPELLNEFVSRYSDYILEPDIASAIKKLEDIRILAAVKMGKKGIYEINKQAEKILARSGLIRPTSEFYENRPLIVTKNYHELDLFNGDIGIIRDYKAWFLDEKGDPRSVAPGLIAEVETVFAMTIHKSQGSEFDQVLMILPDKAEVQILTRELIYTGITRAKTKLIIQGTLDVLQSALSRKVNRVSQLKEKLLSLS
jgi:exodeoxyribonuclease V alpha subunit